jgi:hypothetical protein
MPIRIELQAHRLVVRSLSSRDAEAHVAEQDCSDVVRDGPMTRKLVRTYIAQLLATRFLRSDVMAIDLLSRDK